MAKISRFSLALACAAMLAAPALAESVPDAPVFTENIEQKIAPSNSSPTSETSARVNEASLVIRFDQRMVHYAICHTECLDIISARSQSRFHYASVVDRPQLMMAGDRYRALNTT